MPKLQESQGRYSIAVPQRLIKREGWKRGDELDFVDLKLQGEKEVLTTIQKILRRGKK